MSAAPAGFTASIDEAYAQQHVLDDTGTVPAGPVTQPPSTAATSTEPGLPLEQLASHCSAAANLLRWVLQ